MIRLLGALFRYALASRRVDEARRKYEASAKTLTCVGGPRNGERHVVHAQELRVWDTLTDELVAYRVQRDVHGGEFLAYAGAVRFANGRPVSR